MNTWYIVSDNALIIAITHPRIRKFNVLEISFFIIDSVCRILRYKYSYR